LVEDTDDGDIEVEDEPVLDIDMDPIEGVEVDVVVRLPLLALTCRST